MNVQFPQMETGDAEARELAIRLRALAHPARLQILSELACHDTCHCGEIVRGLPLAQSTVSEHLRILREAGLVRTGNANGNGGRVCYCIDRAEVKKLAEEVNRLLTPIGKVLRARKGKRA